MTHQQCGFSYLLPLGLSASPCTQPRLEGSPAGGSKGKDTRTPLVTYDLLKPDTHGHFIPPPQESAAITERNTGPRHLSISTTFLLCSQIHRKSAEVWCDFRVKWWRDRDVVNTMLRLKSHTTAKGFPNRSHSAQVTYSRDGTNSWAATTHNSSLLSSVFTSNFNYFEHIPESTICPCSTARLRTIKLLGSVRWWIRSPVMQC